MSPLTTEDGRILLTESGRWILLEGETSSTTDPLHDPGRPDLTLVEVSTPDTGLTGISEMASGLVDLSEQPLYGLVAGWARSAGPGLLYDESLLYDDMLLYGAGGGLVFSPGEPQTGVIER